MNRVTLTVVFSCFVLSLASANNANELYKQANAQFSDGKFNEAIESYEAIIGQGIHGAEVYYNLGNAYFKLKNYPSAILNYERAHLLNPDDEDIVFNLELARTFTVDVIEPLPQFFITKWIIGFRNAFNTNTWAYIALAAFVLLLLLVAIFWFTGKYQVKRASFTFGLLMVVIFIVSISFSLNLRLQITRSNHAIIFESAVAAKSSPDNSGQDLFVLHAGTKVQMLRSVGDWCEIKIADGNKGWLLKASFTKI